MTETQSATPGEAEGPVVGQIETDMFCSACGYNLHSQKVLRDTRLGIPVTRCPECGAWQAAGHATSAGQVWLKRAGVFLIALWVGVSLLLLGAALCGMIITDLATASLFTTNIRADRPVWQNDPQFWNDVIPSLIIALMFATTFAGIQGLYTSVIFCAGRRIWSWLVLPLPIVAFLISWPFHMNMYLYYYASSAYRELNYLVICGGLALFEILIIAIAMFLGRPLARMALVAILPQRLLQYIRILWTCDGRTPPWQKSES